MDGSSNKGKIQQKAAQAPRRVWCRPQALDVRSGLSEKWPGAHAPPTFGGGNNRPCLRCRAAATPTTA
jgi:hypothetical protein